MKSQPGVIALVVSLNAIAMAEGRLWLPFSPDYDVYITCEWTCVNNGKIYNHQATDFGRTGNNTSILASLSGEIIYVKGGLAPGEKIGKFPYGNSVRILHDDGFLTIYAHLLAESIDVEVGQRVVPGTHLGMSDNSGSSSGPHLHFEVRDPSGRRVNPYGDPPDYEGGCGTNALWATCPPSPVPTGGTDWDGDGITVESGDCDDTNPHAFPGNTEVCDWADNDCNGTTDEGWRGTGAEDALGAACTVGMGLCTRFGSWICTPEGDTTMCSAVPGSPTLEVCDRYDNDCDGNTDEGWYTDGPDTLDAPCTGGRGICTRYGLMVCTADGTGTTCSATPGSPTAETCNGLDDDCDGSIDEEWHTGVPEDFGAPCTAGTDSCTRTGTYECSPDGTHTVCSVTAPPPTEERCDGADNDCNGHIDDPWTSGGSTDIGQSCTTMWPACGMASSGHWMCTPDGRATVCDAAVPAGCGG